MVNHGRPPSYPTVVTTITTDNGIAAGSNPNNNEIPKKPFTADTTAPTLEAAIRLYERDGNAVASLEACQRLWNDESRAADDTNGGMNINAAATNNSSEFEKHTFPLSRQHNQAVLEHLSALRTQRRRIRPRPSSFDDEGAGTDITSNNNDWEESEDLGVILSSLMLTEQPLSHNNEGNAAKNTMPTNSKPHSTAIAIVTAKQKEKKKKKEQQDQHMGDSLAGEYNRLVGMYNVCLSHYAAGNYQEALNIILRPFVTAMISIQMDNAEGAKVKRGDDGKAGGKQQTNNGELLGENKKFTLGYLVMTTRIAFLVLDCHFAFHGGNGIGLGPIMPKEGNQTGDNAHITTEEILIWIEMNALALTSKGDDVVTDSNFLEQYESIKHDELKFRLHLYRSRMLFLGNANDGSAHHDLDTRTRLSRKELKNAMDIYQNKLSMTQEGKKHEKKGTKKQHGGSKGGSGGTTSVTSMAGGSLVTSVSDALWSEGKGGVGVTRATFEGMPNKNAGQQQQQTSQLTSASANGKVKKDTPNLQVRHESVLYLKANLEHLRGNASKSLKLCAEARSAGRKSRAEKSNIVEREKMRSDVDTGEAKEHSHDATADGETDVLEPSSSSRDGETQMSDDYDEAIYYNNLALLHQSAGKIHLALHYYSYALSYMERVKSLDNNSSTTDGQHHRSAAPSQNFWSNGVARPDISAEILHNSSICAFQAQEFKKAYECMARCVTMSPNVFGKRARCWLRLAQSCIGIYTNLQQKPEANALFGGDIVNRLNYLGSEEDLRNILSNPLQRASSSLYRALHLSSGNFELDNINYEVIPSLKEGSSDVDMDCYETALVSVAYVKLQLKDRVGALEFCQHALRQGTDNVNKDPAASLRLREMAEMYYREATIHTVG